MGDEDLPELVERARRHDPDAWESLYRRAYGRLLAYARRRLPGPTQAEDAVSETMARAVGALDGFTWQGAGFDAWLYGILRNVVLEMGRAAGRSPVAEGGEDAAPGPGPLESALAAEEAEGVRAAFGRLSASDQEILELRVVGGLDAAATGAVVGMRAGAVRMAQARALGRLRALLGEGT